MALFFCRDAGNGRGGATEVKARVWVGFAALCVLSGSGWLLDEWRPAMLPALLGLSVHDGLLAMCFGLGGRGGDVWGAGVAVRSLGEGCGVGRVLFALPGCVVAGAGGHVSGLTSTLAFGLVPVVVVFVVAQRSRGFGAVKARCGCLGRRLRGWGERR